MANVDLQENEKNDGVEGVQVMNESTNPMIVCDSQFFIDCYPFLDKDQS